MTVDLAKWWMIFGILMFLFITLSFVHELFAYIEVFVYFVGCGLVVVSFFKVVKDGGFHSKKHGRVRNSIGKKKGVTPNHKHKKVMDESLPIQPLENLEEEVNVKRQKT